MGKTILITGATDGIGLLTAEKLANAGHTVLIHGRNRDRLNAAAARVGAGSDTYLADLSKMQDVVKLAQDVKSGHGSLDILINNAGVLKTPDVLTETGRDVRFEVNTLAPYVLTRLLLPSMPQSGRVVNLSSAAQAPVDVSAMQSFRAMGDMEAYAQSKLAITIWSAALAGQMPNGPVVVSVNPGSLLASKMVKEGFGLAGSDLNIGADILVDAALGPRFSAATGRYFDNDSGRFAEPHAAALDHDHVASVMAVLDEMAAPYLD
ncbi:SDR family NAD(P)-dependent oxidoreductase [Thalassococcus lentus]|uniref:SDR family NAD(P)-dependent oxidoreductase n=1 Tax=Thalassococcus lentus TaxID=1210524 RepID=A0ABT4XSH7_9RHOB|nr:SDR family NAD(P)-dependent oxidoreductase [Thalassococcus lentus]MDA7424798.1 SDR family NAD(P)-dependent oxidoreductase [Thalassococcus lentus]